MTDTDIPTQAEIANAIYCHAPCGPGNPCDVDCKCEAHFNAIVDLLSSRPTPSEPRIDPDTVHRCAKVTDKQTQDLRDLISWYPGSSAALTWEIAAQHCEACSVTIRSFLTDGRTTWDEGAVSHFPPSNVVRPPQSSPPAGEGYWKKRLSLAQAEIERLRADQPSPPAGEGGIELCTYGPPRERKRYWILKFEDADVGDMHFTDETEAHAEFTRYEDAWTCTLFVTASNRPQSSPPAGEGEIEALRAALKQIVAEADSDDGLTAWDGADIARAALRRAHAPAAEDGWRSIGSALTDARVTGEQRTLFVMRFGKEKFPSFNTVYYDHLQAGAGETHPWIFADGGGAYHRDWPTHWMFTEDAAPLPAPPAARDKP